MRLYYYTTVANFGDGLNAWLWERLLPGRWTGEGPLFTGIGTLLGRTLPKAEEIVVFSSGVGYGALPQFDQSQVQFVCVRGPLSARALGLPPETAVTDGALLLATLKECEPLPADRRRGIVFMPHHQAGDADGYEKACRHAGIEYLSPNKDSRETVERLRRAELVLADAMHAAIVADAMRVPWIPTVSSSRINAFKWLDWTSSMEVPYSPSVLAPAGLAGAVRDRTSWLVGRDHYFSEQDSDAAFRRYRRQDALYRNETKRRVQRATSRMVTGALRTLEMKPLAPLRAAADERFERAAAKSLAAAARRRPFLSDDAIFAVRVRELSKRLDRLAREPTYRHVAADSVAQPMPMRAQA